MKRIALALSVFMVLGSAWASPASAQGLGAQVLTGNEQLLNRGNLDAAQEMFAPAYIAHDPNGDFHGPAGIRQFVSELRTAFPDLHVEVQILMETGDRVAWLRTNRGTQRGAYMGVPASGRALVWQDLVITRYEGGKIVEEWGVSNIGEHLRAP